MLPRRLDVTLALKVINLMPELSGTDKRVVAAIIDHFNRKTARCDPSLERIAWLLGIDRRTVIRSLLRIEKTGILRRVRHGGHFLCNSYEPVWAHCRKLEAAWRMRFRSENGHFAQSAMAFEECHTRHLSGGESVTQTLPINQSKDSKPDEIISERAMSANKPTSCKEEAGKVEEESINVSTPPQHRKWTTSNAQALRTAAERRWNTDLLRLFAATPKIYAEIIGAMDLEIQDGATEVESRNKGAGIVYILQQLQIKNIRAGRTVAERADSRDLPGAIYSRDD